MITLQSEVKNLGEDTMTKSATKASDHSVVLQSLDNQSETIGRLIDQHIRSVFKAAEESSYNNSLQESFYFHDRMLKSK